MLDGGEIFWKCPTSRDCITFTKEETKAAIEYGKSIWRKTMEGVWSSEDYDIYEILDLLEQHMEDLEDEENEED